MSRGTWLHVALLLFLTAALVAIGGCGGESQDGNGASATATLTDSASAETAPADTASAEAAPVSAQSNTSSPGFERALWVWDARVITDETKQAEFLAFCDEKGVALVFAEMGSIFVEPEAASKKPRVASDQLAEFAVAVHGADMELHALDGDASWSRTEAHDVALARLEKALSFNRKQLTDGEKLDGFQFDVEPYVLSGISVGSAEWFEVMGEYLDLVDKLAQAVEDGAPSFELGFAVPFWWDEENTDASMLAWQGKTQPIMHHVMDTLAPLQSGYIAVMAYRDTADGPDGSIAHSKHELAYADRRAQRVRVYVGQETGDVPGSPEKITFWQEGESALNEAVAQIEAELRAHPSFAGVAVHHYDSYRAIATPPPPPEDEPPPGSSFEITSPSEGDEVSRITMVKGVAPAKYVGKSVSVSVYPYGDIWYGQGSGKVNSKGEWRVECHFGNAATRSGHGFTAKAEVGGETTTVDVVRR